MQCPGSPGAGQKFGSDDALAQWAQAVLAGAPDRADVGGARDLAGVINNTCDDMWTLMGRELDALFDRSGGASGGFEEPFGGCGQGVAFGREAGRVGAPGQSGLLAGPQPPAHARAQPSAPWQQEGGLFTGPGFQPDPQLCSPCGWPQAHGSGSARSNKRPRSVGPAATTPMRSDPGDTRGVRGRPQLTHPAPAAAASSPVARRARSVPADEAALTELLCVAGRLDTQMRLSILASLQRLASGYAARTQAAGEGGVTGMPPGALGARKETAQPGGAEGVARGVDESVTALLFHHFWDEAR